ncbi:MAG: hypothetical protein FWE52_03695 [Alphaproteobacteria bacterium]|nr:hypothetical protein [Alphaproteobacteria bacterium]
MFDEIKNSHEFQDILAASHADTSQPGFWDRVEFFVSMNKKELHNKYRSTKVSNGPTWPKKIPELWIACAMRPNFNREKNIFIRQPLANSKNIDYMSMEYDELYSKYCAAKNTYGKEWPYKKTELYAAIVAICPNFDTKTNTFRPRKPSELKFQLIDYSRKTEKQLMTSFYYFRDKGGADAVRAQTSLMKNLIERTENFDQENLCWPRKRLNTKDYSVIDKEKLRLALNNWKAYNKILESQNKSPLPIDPVLDGALRKEFGDDYNKTRNKNSTMRKVKRAMIIKPPKPVKIKKTEKRGRPKKPEPPKQRIITSAILVTRTARDVRQAEITARKPRIADEPTAPIEIPVEIIRDGKSTTIKASGNTLLGYATVIGYDLYLGNTVLGIKVMNNDEQITHHIFQTKDFSTDNIAMPYKRAIDNPVIRIAKDGDNSLRLNHSFFGTINYLNAEQQKRNITWKITERVHG